MLCETITQIAPNILPISFHIWHLTVIYLPTADEQPALNPKNQCSICAFIDKRTFICPRLFNPRRPSCSSDLHLVWWWVAASERVRAAAVCTIDYVAPPSIRAFDYRSSTIWRERTATCPLMQGKRNTQCVSMYLCALNGKNTNQKCSQRIADC